MSRVAPRVGFAFVLGLGLAVLPTLAEAEDAKPVKETPKDTPAKPDWSGFVFVADVVGEVVKSDDKSVTLRITWFEQQQPKGNNNNNRPKLSQNNRNFRNPYQPQATRPPNQPQVQVKEHHHDYVLEYVPQSLVRTKTMTPKLDEKGKKVPHTQEEIDELKTPPGVTGYAANKSDLVPGTIVEIFLVRDKTVTAAKATEDDLRVKYAVILGKDPNPPKDIGGPTKPEPKKKN